MQRTTLRRAIHNIWPSCHVGVTYTATRAFLTSQALAFGLQAGGYTPTELTTEAAVTLEPEGQGFRISRSALTLRAQVPNLDEATFARMAGDAEKNCPVSKVLNAAITLDAKLI